MTDMSGLTVSSDAGQRLGQANFGFGKTLKKIWDAVFNRDAWIKDKEREVRAHTAPIYQEIGNRPRPSDQ